MRDTAPSTDQYRPEAIETALKRVVAFGQKLLKSDSEQLLEIVERQARQLLHQQSESDGYQQQLTTLQQEVKELKENRLTGSVAPFRIDEKKRSLIPKRPGRKPGHRGEWRQSPPPSERDEHIEVPLGRCPDCSHDLEVGSQRVIAQTIIEAPIVTPRVIRLRTYRNHCDHCDTQVRSAHPLQVSTATGAAGTHLGPRALGLAATLNKDLKLTMRKST